MKTDIKKLKERMAWYVAEIKKLKEILHESHQPRKTWSTVGSLEALKREVTVLYSIRANHRGKIHLKGSTLEDQAALIAHKLCDFEFEEASAA